jgi:hypothetical protein
VHVHEQQTDNMFGVLKVGTLESSGRTSAVVLLHHLNMPNFAFAPLQPLLLLDGSTSKKALAAATKSAEESFLTKETYTRPRAPAATVSALCKQPKAKKKTGRGGKGHGANAGRGEKDYGADTPASDTSKAATRGRRAVTPQVYASKTHGQRSTKSDSSSHDEEDDSNPPEGWEQTHVSTTSESEGGTGGKKRARSPEPSQSAQSPIGGEGTIIDRLFMTIDKQFMALDKQSKVSNVLANAITNKAPESVVPVKNFPQGPVWKCDEPTMAAATRAVNQVPPLYAPQPQLQFAQPQPQLALQPALPHPQQYVLQQPQQYISQQLQPQQYISQQLQPQQYNLMSQQLQPQQYNLMSQQLQPQQYNLMSQQLQIQQSLQSLSQLQQQQQQLQQQLQLQLQPQFQLQQQQQQLQLQLQPQFQLQQQQQLQPQLQLQLQPQHNPTTDSHTSTSLTRLPE